MPFWDSIVGSGQSGPGLQVDEGQWEQVAEALQQDAATLLGLWGDRGVMRMSLLDETTGDISVLALNCPHGSYPSVGRWHAPAQRLERAARDLFGLVPRGAPDMRPWLDHGVWGVRRPLEDATEDAGTGDAYEFLGAEGTGLHRIPVGPVHAGIIEPGHFRFTANGESIVRLEARLGYAHKGVEGLMAGADVTVAAQLAGRVSGDSTVAYAMAFSQAVETIWQVEVPPRAVWLRALMAEMERLANHLGDIGAICNDAAFSLMHSHCGVLRETVLRAADTAFGHRLMRDCIRPGGVSADLGGPGEAAIRGLVDAIGTRLPAIVTLYDSTPSLQDRTVGTGRLDPALARAFGAGGFVGRASGRGFDARKTPGYPPYGDLTFDVPVRHAGDVDARIWIRIREAQQCLALIGQLLDNLPAGDIRARSAPRQMGAGEGQALVEGFRGDVLVWLRLAADGRVARCHLRDPSWFQWPLLEAAIVGNIVADFPLCNKSFNCSYSGHDL